MGFALVVITNQSGLARGLFSEEQFMHLMQWMDWSLTNRHVNLDGIYFCPHHPQATVEKLRQECACRKPKPGMLLNAQRYFQIDMTSSYMVGDKLEDMLVGRAARVGTRVLVRSGKAVTKESVAEADWIIDSVSILPAMIKQRYSIS